MRLNFLLQNSMHIAIWVRKRCDPHHKSGFFYFPALFFIAAATCSTPPMLRTDNGHILAPGARAGIFFKIREYGNFYGTSRNILAHVYNIHTALYGTHETADLGRGLFYQSKKQTARCAPRQRRTVIRHIAQSASVFFLSFSCNKIRNQSCAPFSATMRSHR